jgi:hypothetical protein
MFQRREKKTKDDGEQNLARERLSKILTASLEAGIKARELSYRS